MCYAVYIGTDIKQTIESFIPDKTFLYLEELTKEKESTGLRSKFSKRNIYYVGSYQGCSCGFAYDPTSSEVEIIEDDDKSETKKALKSVKALIALIDSITKMENLEFYCCWEGDWESSIEEKIEIDIRLISLGVNYFDLVEKQFILFKQQTNLLPQTNNA